MSAVCPGIIATRMTAPTREQRGEAIIVRTPLGRFGEPREIAEMVVWLSAPILPATLPERRMRLMAA
jgi:3-oxoacyl-[acyl-carrier protein] reductase